MTCGRPPAPSRPTSGAPAAAALAALVPAPVRAFAARGETWDRWTRDLPSLLATLLEEWELGLDLTDAAVRHGHCAIVVPVRSARHPGPAVLKVGLVDDETEHEALALQRWGGRGAVRLLQADPRRGALLLARLPGPDLRGLWDVEACEIVGAAYASLHRPAPPQLHLLPSRVGSWLDALAGLPRDAPLPRRLVEQAVSVGRDLCADPGSTGRLLHGDLHYDNVLADAEGRWLVIDPKPVNGDPHWEPAPMLWNRWDDVVSSGQVRDAVRARFHALVDAGGLDEHRVRDWTVVRMLLSASWELDDARAEGRAPDAEHLTRCVTVAKAVQD